MMETKKTFQLDVIITDGQKVGRVFTVRRTSQGMFVFPDLKGGITKHLTFPPDGCIHMTYTPKGLEPHHEFWVPSEFPHAYGVEFRVSDPNTWGHEPRKKADETVCYDIRSYVGGGKRDKVTVLASVLEQGMEEPLGAFSSKDVLVWHVIKYIDDRRLVIIFYTEKEQ